MHSYKNHKLYPLSQVVTLNINDIFPGACEFAKQILSNEQEYDIITRLIVLTRCITTRANATTQQKHVQNVVANSLFLYSTSCQHSLHGV